MRRSWAMSLLGAAVFAAVVSAAAEPSGEAASAVAQSEGKTTAQRETRRKILARAFAGRGIDVEWFDRSFADEIIDGADDGPIEAAASRVLARANHVIAYDMSGPEPRITRILVLGRGVLTGSVADVQQKLTTQRQPRATRPRAAAVPAEAARARGRVERIRARMQRRMRASATAVDQW